jgi:hypothetical protein
MTRKPIRSHAASVEALLDGAERGRTRPRGFAPWQPHDKSLKLLKQVQAVLDEYAEQLPITVRQIYYRLIGRNGYDKGDKASERLGEVINRACRARLIPMSAIRDDGGVKSYPPSWRDALHFMQSVCYRTARLQLDHSEGQPVRLVIMCEAAGMVPQLERVAHPYGVPVRSSGGFESVTDKYDFAKEVADDGRSTEVLHIGDHDPSGAHMFIALAEDIKAFVRELGGSVSFTRCRDTGADRQSWPRNASQEQGRQTRLRQPDGADLSGRSHRTGRAGCATPSRAGSTTRPCAVSSPARSGCGGSWSRSSARHHEPLHVATILKNTGEH